jgi:8-oxo-dGTP pyrophosphatase MutT (NUDIX family)
MSSGCPIRVLTPPRLSYRRETELEHSAGGVVLRGDEVVVIVPIKRDPDGNPVLGLPKGHLDPGETAEQAATREVREEAGVTGQLRASLGEIRYEYQRRGHTVGKRVEFFLFDYEHGDPADHDDEIEEARWMALPDAIRDLTYAAERQILARALSLREADV